MSQEPRVISEIIPKQLVYAFKVFAHQKIRHERWTDRNANRKEQNFVMSSVTEHAWKEVLGKHDVRYAYHGLYIGPVELSNKEDFTIWIDDKKKTIGMRSRVRKDLDHFKEVSYPDDRLKLEPDSISDFIVVSSYEENEDGSVTVNFYGAIEKEEFMSVYKDARVLYSEQNQERFRVVPIANFKFEAMEELLSRAKKME